MFKIAHVPPLPPASLVGAQAHIWIPRAALSSCICMAISRNTYDATMREEQRYNHFPAGLHCSICWYFRGSGELLEPDYPASENSPRSPFASVAFFGPFNRPFISRNPGPMHAMILAFMPDAFFLLTGIDPGTYINRAVAVDEIFDAPWRAMCKAVETADDDERRVRIIEEFIHPLWQRARPDVSSPGRALSDWMRSLMLRATLSGWGHSARQLERRIKRWTGQPLRRLRGFVRSEQAFFDALTMEKSGSLNWNDLANSLGYADQSHLIRHIRKLTGFPPEALRRRIIEDETFWIYRLSGLTDHRLHDD